MAAHPLISIPYHVTRSRTNRGAKQSFAMLTGQGRGDFFAYCDQDDVWREDKIAALYAAVIERDGVPLACSDMALIDGAGNETRKRLHGFGPGMRCRGGERLQRRILFRNPVSGCAMLVRGDVARRALPFVLYHDAQIALFAAECGQIAFIGEPLVRHRVHAGNLTGPLKNVHSKADYCRKVAEERRLCARLLSGVPEGAESLGRALADGAAWLAAREAYLSGRWSRCFAVLRPASLWPALGLFELLLPLLSGGAFSLVRGRMWPPASATAARRKGGPA